VPEFQITKGKTALPSANQDVLNPSFLNNHSKRWQRLLRFQQ